MQRGAVERLGACARARVGCVTSCLPRTNIHTTTILARSAPRGQFSVLVLDAASCRLI